MILVLPFICHMLNVSHNGSFFAVCQGCWKCELKHNAQKLSSDAFSSIVFWCRCRDDSSRGFKLQQRRLCQLFVECLHTDMWPANTFRIQKKWLLSILGHWFNGETPYLWMRCCMLPAADWRSYRSTTMRCSRCDERWFLWRWVPVEDFADDKSVTVLYLVSGFHTWQKKGWFFNPWVQNFPDISNLSSKINDFFFATSTFQDTQESVLCM